LQKGGNAADAAVAMAACLNVTEPCSTGLGGDCFVLYFDAKSRRVRTILGNGASPAALSLDLLKSRGLDGGIPALHGLSVTVPGRASCCAPTPLTSRISRDREIQSGSERSKE
jgi:gamma-glutamyltranspeptidase / glutathione hydrolase